MKAILLTGGRGTRLRPLTHTKNKHALPIANKPLIMYPFEAIVDSGIKEIGIIVNETRAEIEAILGDGSEWGVKLTYIFQDHPGGLAHAMSFGEEFVGEDKFVLVLGDNMLQKGFKDIVEKFSTDDRHGHLFGIKTPVSEHPRLGMATVDPKTGLVLRYVEKPGVVDMSPLYNPESSYAVPGFYFFSHHAFQCFHGEDKIQPSNRGEYEISAPYNWLIEHGYTNITLSEVEGWWKDPGKPEDLLSANQIVLDWQENFLAEGKIKDSQVEGNVEIMAGSTVEGSKLKGPITIGKNVQIKNSQIGPYTAIGDNCVLENADVEYSILMGNDKVSGVDTRLANSIIGWDVEVSKSKEEPDTASLFIGDNSRVEL